MDVFKLYFTSKENAIYFLKKCRNNIEISCQIHYKCFQHTVNVSSNFNALQHYIYTPHLTVRKIDFINKIALSFKMYYRSCIQNSLHVITRQRSIIFSNFYLMPFIIDCKTHVLISILPTNFTWNSTLISLYAVP